MLTATFGFIGAAVNNVAIFAATHANDAYLHAAYVGQIASTLSLHQLFV
jgi:hypothetical protein